jgi:hypothetical protein
VQMRKSVSGCDDFDAAPSGIDLSSQFAVRGFAVRGSGFAGPSGGKSGIDSSLFFSTHESNAQQELLVCADAVGARR